MVNYSHIFILTKPSQIMSQIYNIPEITASSGGLHHNFPVVFGIFHPVFLFYSDILAQILNVINNSQNKMLDKKQTSITLNCFTHKINV